MTDYKWVDINSTGLRKAIVMVAERFHNGDDVTNEEIGMILHKTTQRSGLKNAPIMIASIKEMARVYESRMRLFSKISDKDGLGAIYKYDTKTNCVQFIDSNLCIGISNSVPTSKDFESISDCSTESILTILNLCDGKLYKKPVMVWGNKKVIKGK